MKIDFTIDTKTVKQLYVKHKNGFYLTKTKTEYKNGYAFNGAKANYSDIDNGKFIMFNSKNDEPLYLYLENKIGKWTLKNANKWRNYVVVNITDCGDELYSW
jgi:hypothetical protein